MGIILSRKKQKKSITASAFDSQDQQSAPSCPTEFAEDIGSENYSYNYVTDVIHDLGQHNGDECLHAEGCVALKSFKADDRENVIAVLSGALTNHVNFKARIVRIFTSSTFTDTFVERNYLMQHAYPRLKKHCQEYGYEFQVVDMRWGIRNEAMDDHQVLNLCMKEIENCQRISTGPSFLSLLSEKYGYRPVPPRIIEEEFTSLLSNVSDASNVEFLKLWYRLDQNNVPRVYILQPISSCIPDFINQSNATSRERGMQEWITVMRRLTNILRSAAQKVLLADHKRKYFASVSEIEIEQGLLNTNHEKHGCFWFKRSIENLAELDGDEVGNYRDDDDQETLSLLANLQTKMTNELDPENVKQYHIYWDEKGVNPENPDHASYLSELCKDVYELVSKRIDRAIEERSNREISLSIYEEVCQHMAFARSRCEYFQGRGEQLDAIHKYLKGSSRLPLVVHGESGSGKTSVLSMVQKCCEDWFSSDIAVVVRFLGTTPDSSLLRRLLTSLCLQIAILLDKNYKESDQKVLKALKDDFSNLLDESESRFTNENPLIVVLDSLDQLSPEDGAFQLTWLPTKLPPWVKMVISTISTDRYKCLDRVQGLLPSYCFLSIPRLPIRDAVCIVDRWLLTNQRTLTDAQRRVLLDAFEKCSLPIFLKVSFEEALRWKSYTEPEEIKLKSTVRGVISGLFETMERKHGKIFVKHALSYITAAKNGLTESEIEDILSCDDEVLDDVYQYWVPPVRRIPPLLWLRLKHDLSSYLVDRGADDSMVVTWYHRQFIEAANERYLSDENETIHVHGILADFFLGLWSNGSKKPFKGKDGSIQLMDRLVASQPIVFKSMLKTSNAATSINLRKISELPYHLVMAKEIELLKKECLCNYEFLLYHLQSRGLSEVMDNFDLALSRWPKDKDLTTIHETLQLSRNALSLWPGQLASQLLSRIPKHVIQRSDCLTMLERQASVPSLPAVIPVQCCLTSPGGPLLQSLSGSSEIPIALRLSKDGKTLVSIGENNEMLVWDARAGRVIRNIDCPGGGTTYCCLSKTGSIIVVSRLGTINCWSTSTGQPIFSLNGHHETAPISICEVAGKEALVAYIEHTLNVIDFETAAVIKQYGTKLTKKQCERPIKRILTSWKNRCVVAHKDLIKSTNSLTLEFINTDLDHDKNFFCIKTNKDIMSFEILNNDKFLVTYAGMEEDLNASRRPSQRPSVASNWQNMTLQLWDLKSMTPAGSLSSDTELVRCSCVSPDRNRIIMLCNSTFIETACEFKAFIKIYSVSEQDSIKLALSYPSTVTAICGVGLKSVFTSSLDKIIRVWDLARNFETGLKLQEIYGDVNGDSGTDLNTSLNGHDGSSTSLDDNRADIEDKDDAEILSFAAKPRGKDSGVQMPNDESIGCNDMEDGQNITTSNFHTDDLVLEHAGSTNPTVSVSLIGNSGIANGYSGKPRDTNLNEKTAIKDTNLLNTNPPIEQPGFPTGKKYLRLSFSDMSKVLDPTLQENDGGMVDIYVESCVGNILIYLEKQIVTSVYTAIVWNLESNLRIRISELNNPEACIVDEDCSYIVILSSSKLSVYKSSNGDLVRDCPVEVNSNGSERLIGLASDKVLVVDDKNDTVNIFSVPHLEYIGSIRGQPDETVVRIFTSEDKKFFIKCVRKIKSSNVKQEEFFAEIWRSKDICKMQTLDYKHLSSEFSDTAIFKDGSVLVDSAFDRRESKYRLFIWDAEKSSITYITPADFPINIFTLSPNCRTLFIGTWNGDMLCHEIGSTVIKHLAKVHNGPVHKILLSSSGEMALTIAGPFNSRDRSVRLWRRQNGKMITEYTPDVKISSIVATKDFKILVFEIQGKLIKFVLQHDYGLS